MHSALKIGSPHRLLIEGNLISKNSFKGGENITLMREFAPSKLPYTVNDLDWGFPHPAIGKHSWDIGHLHLMKIPSM